MPNSKTAATRRLKEIKSEAAVGDSSDDSELLREALGIYREWYRGGKRKLRLLQSPDTELEIVGRWEGLWRPGARRFHARHPELASGGVVVSHNFTRTVRDRLSSACRMAVREDEPAALRAKRAPGIELDHAGVPFCDIVAAFENRHPGASHSLYSRPGDGIHVLPDALAADFRRLHREMTNNWADIEAIPRAQHTELTRNRRGTAGAVDCA